MTKCIKIHQNHGTMHSLLQSTIFIAYINQIALLCFLKEDIVIAQTDKFIENPYHILGNIVKQIDNKEQNENDKLFEKNVMLEEDTDCEFENDALYKYDNFLNDYYFEDIILKSNSTDDCKQKARSHLSPKIDIRIHRQTTKLKIHRLLELMKIWFFLYLAIAIPLWCKKGWCCCCLLCKSLKSNNIIEEAKFFLESNPPGIFIHRGGVIYYEPSDNEKECYEKLEHVIKTI